jgi:hypothetical protein
MPSQQAPPRWLELNWATPGLDLIQRFLQPMPPGITIEQVALRNGRGYWEWTLLSKQQHMDLRASPGAGEIGIPFQRGSWATAKTFGVILHRSLAGVKMELQC